MGGLKKQRRQYATPERPWDKDRMGWENDLIRKYGLKSKKELWKTETILRNFRRKARDLMAASGDQAEKGARQMVGKLRRLGLVDEESTLFDVLSLDIDDVLDRRLQSVVYKKGLARSPKEARQMVVHGHIVVGDKRVTVPGYLVEVEEEKEVDHHPNSSFKGRIEPEPVEAAEE